MLSLSPSYDVEFQNNQFMDTADALLETVLSANAGNVVEALRIMEGIPARLKANTAK